MNLRCIEWPVKASLMSCKDVGLRDLTALGVSLGKVDSFEIPGLELVFYSSDHPPPHFHVRKPDMYEIRVFFLNCTVRSLAMEVKWARGGKGPTALEVGIILSHVLANRVSLQEEWERKVCPR